MSQEQTGCYICEKHAGRRPEPPGGYLYSDRCFRVGHAPPGDTVPGTLVVESTRHYLDFADMTAEEAAAYGALLRRLFLLIKEVTGAERVYQLIMVEGPPHFHAWLVPRGHVPERGLEYLSKSYDSREEDIIPIVRRLRDLLETSQ